MLIDFFPIASFFFLLVCHVVYLIRPHQRTTFKTLKPFLKSLNTIVKNCTCAVPIGYCHRFFYLPLVQTQRRPNDGRAPLEQIGAEADKHP